MKTLLFAAAAALALSGTANAADPKVEKLYKEAHKLHEDAQKKRAEAHKRALQAAYDEARASHDDFEAHLLVARALRLSKADANKIKAHQLRHEARLFWESAHRHARRAHMEKHYAAVHNHRAAELNKAAGLIKDQPTLADGLKADAAKNTAMAKRDEENAQHNEKIFKADEEKARSLWAEAKKLDAAAEAQVGAPPAVPAPPAPPAPPAAVNAATVAASN